MSIVKWATELAESLGKPEAAKFIYDWAKTSGGKIPNAAETERLSRAVGEGFNAVGYRYSANPAKDEQHLQKMLLDPKRLADENRAFHVDLTPGGPAARARAFNVTGNYDVFEPGYADVRPLALRLENVVRGSDEQANATRFLTEALKRNSSGVRYTPTAGELAGPARDVDSLFYTLAKSSGSNYQPSVAMIDPTAVRDLRTAAFTPRTKAALAAAVAAGTTPLLQAKEVSTMANPLDEFSPPRYRSAGRRPEANNDRTAAANAPLSALRGWAAGTAGLPGDIEGLARAGISQLPPQVLAAFPALRAFGIGSRADPTPQLPTTEFYNEYLPGAQLNATPTGKAFTTAGNLFGGTGSTTLARYGIKSAKATGQALGPTAVRIGEDYLQRQGLMPGVIKQPGGNFLKGEIEDSVSSMKRHVPSDVELAKAAFLPPIIGDEARLRATTDSVLNTFIDKKIAPYIRDEMATPNDPLRAMAEKYAVDKPVRLAEVQGRIDAFAAKMEQTARKRGVPVEQLTSMRQQMIGLEKEKALVEAREGLHFTPDDTNFVSHYYRNRDKAGTDLKGMGQSPLARSWEDVSDSAFGIETAGDILRFKDSFAPWLSKVPPETKVYRPKSNIIERTGFDHLVDELRNATAAHGKQKELDSWLKLAKTPEEVAAARQAFVPSLPANLHIDPADLGKLTMTQAVDRVADINAWRATQKIEANQLLANNAATQLVKEYPGQGLKWVELTNKPATELPPGYTIEEKPYNDYTIKRILRPDGEGISAGWFGHPGQGSPDPLVQFSNFEGRKFLEDALKYEGDTMQHCVGGYCPDVAEGRSRIYSLRDDKGQPQVTIEVKPHEGWFTKADRMPDPSGKNRSFHQLIDNERSELARQKGGFGYIGESYEDIANRLASQYQLEAKPNISQIKGFKNKKPADEYLPFVQDFIKSDNWSDVGDLKNSGMIDIQKSSVPWPENTTGRQVDALLGGGINGTKTPKYKSSDFYKLAEQDLGSRYVTEQDYQGWLTKQLDLITPTEGMAHGGLVSTNFDPIRIKQIIAGLDDDFDPERIQQIVAQHESAYA